MQTFFWSSALLLWHGLFDLGLFICIYIGCPSYWAGQYTHMLYNINNQDLFNEFNPLSDVTSFLLFEWSCVRLGSVVGQVFLFAPLSYIVEIAMVLHQMQYVPNNERGKHVVYVIFCLAMILIIGGGY